MLKLSYQNKKKSREKEKDLFPFFVSSQKSTSRNVFSCLNKNSVKHNGFCGSRASRAFYSSGSTKASVPFHIVKQKPVLKKVFFTEKEKDNDEHFAFTHERKAFLSHEIIKISWLVGTSLSYGSDAISQPAMERWKIKHRNTSHQSLWSAVPLYLHLVWIQAFSPILPSPCFSIWPS